MIINMGDPPFVVDHKKPMSIIIYIISYRSKYYKLIIICYLLEISYRYRSFTFENYKSKKYIYQSHSSGNKYCFEYNHMEILLCIMCSYDFPVL